MTTNKIKDSLKDCKLEFTFESGKKIYLEGFLDAGDDNIFDMNIYEDPSLKDEGVALSDDMRTSMRNLFVGLHSMLNFSEQDPNYSAEDKRVDIDIEKEYDRLEKRDANGN